MTVAALYVQTGGCYFDLPGVDPWDEERDARKYAGPHPVVAHPPCARWCRLAGLVEARYGRRFQRGKDDGCFATALASVRTYGGVPEHPAHTEAFRAFGLPPPRRGAWQRCMCGGWVTEVAQVAYGHRAQKLTWLYYVGETAPRRNRHACAKYLLHAKAVEIRVFSSTRRCRPEKEKPMTVANQMTDAEYVRMTLKPAAVQYVQGISGTPEAKDKVMAMLENAPTEMWTAAHRTVGLVGKHLAQEICRMMRSK